MTPPLDGTILPGITRNSILTLTKEQKQFKVSERVFKIQEVIKAVEEGRLYEVFGSGTAALVSPVCQFNYEGTVFPVPIDEKIGAGKLTQKVLQLLTEVQTGIVDRPEWQFVL